MHGGAGTMTTLSSLRAALLALCLALAGATVLPALGLAAQSMISEEENGLEVWRATWPLAGWPHMARQHSLAGGWGRLDSGLPPAREPPSPAAGSWPDRRPPDRSAAGRGWGRGALAGPRAAAKFRNLITEWPRKGKGERGVRGPARRGCPAARSWRGRGGGSGLCAPQHVPRRAGGRRGRAPAQPPVCALALCVPGRVAGSGLGSLCPPPPPPPSAPRSPLACHSARACPGGGGCCFQLGCQNPVGRRPYRPHPHSPGSSLSSGDHSCLFGGVQTTALKGNWANPWRTRRATRT